MLCIHLKNDDPNFCLAAEEFLLKHYSDDIFMLWQSHDTVVVGKHQNAMAEINYPFVRRHGIRVARRISGGGTVFHDRGNINFTFIKNVAGPHEISFKRFTAPIVSVLHALGVAAETSGRNDLLVAGKKISGNAEHVFKKRVLHHGTLLFSSDLENLGNAIRVTPGKYTGKAVQSNRSPVANISGFLSSPLAISDFMQQLFQHQLATVAGSRMYQIPADEREQIERLAREKFETPEWQFNYSPAYLFQNSAAVGEKTVSVSLEVEKGVITRAKIAGSYYPAEIQTALQQILPGLPHAFEALSAAHRSAGFAVPEETIYLYF